MPDFVGTNGCEESVRIIASEKNWVVGDAVSQLRRVARLPGVVRAVGMPDLHPGKGAPIGAAILTSGVLYPHLAGNDIGCGMSLWQTETLARKVKIDRWVRKLSGLERPWDGDVSGWLADAGIEPTPYDAALGTIGGGNHFAELQRIETAIDIEALAMLGLYEDRLAVLIHSGSRGLGEAVLQSHLADFDTAGVADGSDNALQYLARHDHALRWAALNRSLIACRFFSQLGMEGQPILDVCHNSITSKNIGGLNCWLHRKGAAPADLGVVVIPGSRGTLTYLVRPKGDVSVSGFSVAHGAGRKWTRTDARARLDRNYSVKMLQRTPLGGRVICDDKELLYEEAPQAYKNIDVVIQDMVEAGLVDVLATLRPLITYKVRVASK